MANKEPLELPYGDEELLMLFQRLAKKLFVIVPDNVDKCKRIFFSQEDADTWFEARDNKNMTPEIAALEFANTDGQGTIPGTEQFQLNFNVINDGEYASYGTKGHTLRFSFSTTDRISEAVTEEAIEVHFIFESESGAKTDTHVFQYQKETTEYDITPFLEAGENVITMLVEGRSSHLKRTIRCTYQLVDLRLNSNFDFFIAKNENRSFGIPYDVSGPGQKEIEFVIDNDTPFNEDIPEAAASRIYSYTKRLTPGTHTLQMKAKTTLNGKPFESEMFYFIFAVNGQGLDLTTVLIKAVFPSGTPYFRDRNPGLIGEQYMDYLLQWAYFSTSQPNAIVMWKTMLNGIETVVGSQEVDEKEGTVDTLPDPVKFQPDTVGKYDLFAYIKGDEEHHIGNFTITVVENTAGLREAPNYTMKLNAKGRSNNEPADTRSDWSYGEYKTHFNEHMGFDGLAGYTGDAVRLDGGAAAYNDCKPFAVENGILQYGMTAVFDFMTRNVEDESIPLIEIGDPTAIGTAYFAIYGKKVIFRPSSGAALTYEFADEERTHLGILIMPKEGVTDKQMMFFFFNGIQAPGMAYDNTAVFNIGSTEDKDSTIGCIKMGDATGKAAIDIYGIRVYPVPVSTWEGMNNFMIDAGTNVGEMMKKNALFTENNFNKIIGDRVKEQFRTLEVIGSLGELEQYNEKHHLWASVRYTDPFNPKFNFERMDAGAYIETAGQSRLADLMAKSFHLDMNENDTVALYQDGTLCHKNRFIFAEGNIPENGVRIDVCGADSSIARNASHFKMVNKYYPLIELNGTHPLRTPAQEYVLSGKWSADMAAKYGGTAADYPWTWNINIAPDSVPIVILWHETENDPLQFYALGVMMEEKKAAYANGNHSIYLKKCEDGTLDPYDRYAGKSGDRGWDNEGTIEIEILRGSNFTYNISVEGWNATTREENYEVSFPKSKDMKADPVLKEWVWTTFFNEFAKPMCDICADQTIFDTRINDIIFMPSFCMYYNKAMDKKMFDSLCRNMKLLRVKIGGKWLWFAKWWDTDVQTGLYQSGAMGAPVDADRNTRDANGHYLFSGRDDDGTSMRMWDRLEQNQEFRDMCLAMAKASYAVGWTASNEIKAQDDITNQFSESLYNVDGIMKYLRAFRLGNNYMIRHQGSSVPYRHGFLKASYGVREAKMAIGDYFNDAVYFRAQGAKTPKGAVIKAAQPYWFGYGLDTTNYATGVEKDETSGEFRFDIPDGVTVAREPIRFYGASKMSMIDISDFLPYFSDAINCGYLTSAQQVYIGYRTHEALAQGGFSEATGISFTGLGSLKVCKEISIAGLKGLQTFDITQMAQLNTFLAFGSGLKTFNPANGAKFNRVELPDTLQSVTAQRCKLGNVTFWLTTDTGVVPMSACPTSLLVLELTAMGDDAGTHQLVHLWLTMLSANPALINSAQISYRAINWTGVSKADILTLARIPAAQRNLTGYIKTDEVYTAEERTTLLNAFGENVFDPKATSLTLVCDGEGDGISISGTGDTMQILADGTLQIEQGNTLRLTGAGFPIANSSKENYRWRVWLNNEWLMGSDDDPVVSFGNMTLNSLTGEISGTEADRSTNTYRINCLDIVSRANGEIAVKVTPRSYPTTVSTELVSSQQTTSVLDGVIQVTSIGALSFAAKHLPEVFTGTMRNAQWEVVGTEDGMTLTSDDLTLRLSISRMPQDDVTLTIKYRSEWNDNQTTLTAQDVQLAVMTVIAQLIINDATDGNDVLFRALEAAGIEHADPNFYNSMEVKMLFGEFSAKALLGEDAKNLRKLTAGRYFIPQYLKNADAFDFSDTGLGSNVTYDAAKTPWARSINLEGTFASITF